MSAEPMKNTGQRFEVVATNPGRGVPDRDDTPEQAAEKSRNAKKY